MKKKFLMLCLLGLTSFGVANAEQKEKHSITIEQLSKGLPEGVLTSKPYVVGWYDDANIIFSERKDGKSSYFLYNTKTKEKTAYQMPKPKVKSSVLSELSKDLKNPTFSPDSTMIAYTKDNNLYVLDVATSEHKAITTDGTDLIMNGWSSWVYYEEILGRPTQYKAFWWSPDSKKIAYYKFDDSNVPMFPIYHSAGKHGTLTETRYPKAGDENPKVEIAMVDLESNKTTWAKFDKNEDQYFGIPFWSAESDKFMIPWMPREQNHLILYEVSPADGSKTHIYEEHQDTWIDWINAMKFVDNGFYMIRDFDGWEQIYYQSFDGKILNKLTDGNNWDTKIIKVDQKNGVIFYTSRAEISTRNDVYKLNIKKATSERISMGDYNYSGVKISPNNKSFVADISNVSTSNKTVLITIGKKPKMTILADIMGDKYDNYKISESQMLFIEVDGYKIPATITLPIDMDPNKKHPVIISMYGGPNSGTVMDTWKRPTRNNQIWANQGVIQIAIDHRAAGHNGKEGVNFIHRSLGQIELHDYIEWVKYLRTLPYVDATKIGITGFSFGGTMTTLALTDGAEYFQYGIAGGGVYDWQLYDTHYTERYMDRPQDNPEGYAFTRVWNRVEKYNGGDSSMLKITHGSSDDNVHLQNTMQLVDALHKENKEFELMIYPGGYHGYRGYQGIHSTKNDFIFWYKHLLDKKVPKVLKDAL